MIEYIISFGIIKYLSIFKLQYIMKIWYKIWAMMYNHQQNKCHPKGVYLPISMLHSISAIANLLAHFGATVILEVANLLAHNSMSQICYCGQISLQTATVNCSFSDNLSHLGVSFNFLEMVHIPNKINLHKFLAIFY